MSKNVNDTSCFFGTDADVDCTINDVVVHSVVRFGHEFIVTLRGGEGEWFSGAEQRMVPMMNEGDLSVVFGYRDVTERLERVLTTYEHVLEEWQAAGTRLSLMGARNHSYALVENEEHWMQIPRS
jgi:hypothetical protein